jgi:O-antigen/teichoic acid export membrane protein
MSYAKRVAYNTVAQIVGRLVTTVTSLATVSLLNATLKPEGWGSYVALTTYLGFFAVLADMGINLLYVREISREPEHIDEITSRFLGFRLVTAALVLLVIAPLIGMLVPVYHAFLLPIFLLAVGQFILTLNQMCVTVVQAQLRMDKAMISDVIGRIGILVGTVFAVAKASDAHRLVAAVSAIVIGNLINLLVSYSFIRGQVKIRPRFVLGEWPALFVQILPMASLAVLGMIHFKADSIILTLYKPQVDVGIYGNAYKVLEILITLPAMFIGGLFPEMNQLFLKGKEGLTNLMPLFL